MDQVKQRLGQATGLSPEVLSNIFHMKQRGLSLELISQKSDVELEVLKQFLPQVIKKTVEAHALAGLGQGPCEINIGERAHTLGSPDDCKTNNRSPPTTTEESKQPPQPTQTLPKSQHIPVFFYCLRDVTDRLHRVNLVTGEQSCHKVAGISFEPGRRWSELPGRSLLITGGYPGVMEVVKIDTLREFAVSSQPPMHTSRHNHAAVYHSQYLYALGGYNEGRYLSECERYSCAESRWEVLPALPVAGFCMSAVEVENSVYALGGHVAGEPLDIVQKLSLDSLAWELMQLKLPQAASWPPCFKSDTQVYLVIKKTLYSFTPLQVRRVNNLRKVIKSHSSYYSRGTLYYSQGFGISSLALGI
jgi:hypothetical protein